MIDAEHAPPGAACSSSFTACVSRAEELSTRLRTLRTSHFDALAATHKQLQALCAAPPPALLARAALAGKYNKTRILSVSSQMSHPHSCHMSKI